MKKILYALALLLSFNTLYATEATIPLNKIKAIVNSSIITTNNLADNMNIVLNNLKLQHESNISLVRIESQVLEHLITERLQLQTAHRLHIDVTDDQVALVIKNIAKEHNLTPEQLQANMLDQGLSFNDFESQMRNQLILRQLKQSLIDSKLVIPKQTVLSIYNSEIYKNQVNYKLSVILISLPNSIDTNTLYHQQQLASQAYADLLGGHSFTSVALQYSMAPNAANGGDIGWKSAYTLPTIVSKALESVPIGGVTPVLALSDGFYIFKVEDKNTLRNSESGVKYHIRILTLHVNEYNSLASYNKLVKLTTQIQQEAQSTGNIDKVFAKYAKKYSDSKTSISGGDMGYVIVDSAKPALSQAILTTSVNEISQPFRTVEGWNIIEVMDKKTTDVAQDVALQAIRQNLIQTKSAILYNQWLRDLRSSAFVKIIN